MDTADNLEEIIHQSAQGDGEYFKLLYEHLVDKVFAYIKYRTNSEEDAFDITQEVFVDVYKALPKFSYTSREQFYGFVFTISKRKLAKYYGDKHTKAAKNTTEFLDEAHTAQQEDTVLNDEVQIALEALDEVSREIIILHHWSRYTFPEIATLVHMKESAVRVRHHRALKTLSAHFEIV